MSKPAPGIRSILMSSLCLCVSVVQVRAADTPWTTYRGNPQRTANTDGLPGPTAPKVLWAFKSQEHFVASPLPLGNRVVFSGLGAFNVSTLAAFNAEPGGARIAWKKSAPYLTLPVVSTPAVVGDKLVFGDGMHQTDGAILHCIGRGQGPHVLAVPGPR